MKILYGVQGTGNGHITRARVMAKALAEAGVDVDFLFSGRDESDFFDMDCFHNSSFKRGLTFHLDNGKIKHAKTVACNNVFQFRKDVKALPLSTYDLVLTDFEPITAWASKKAGVASLGIGHQYVFDCPVPQEKASFISRQVYGYFAPVVDALALHWHHFDSPILPPIVETNHTICEIHPKTVVVYLPLENQKEVEALVAPFVGYQFIIYSSVSRHSHLPHIIYKPLSRDGFQKDLLACEFVIANAGFELSSEALSLGKKILVRPLKGQSEQQSNALALTELAYGSQMQTLNRDAVADFLSNSKSVQINYPNVADYIVEWMTSGMPERNAAWYQKCWKSVVVNRKG